MDTLDKPLALFYDATRARVLDVMLANSQALNGRATARRCDLSPTTTNLALGDLASRGIVSSRAEGRSHLWSLSMWRMPSDPSPHSDVDIRVIANDHAQGQNFRRRAPRSVPSRVSLPGANRGPNAPWDKTQRTGLIFSVLTRQAHFQSLFEDFTF